MSNSDCLVSGETEKKCKRILYVSKGSEKGCVDEELMDFLSERFEIVRVDDIKQALSELRQGHFNFILAEGSELFPVEQATVAEQAAVILDTIGQGVAILDLDGNIVWGNCKLNELSGKVLHQLSHCCLELFREKSGNVKADDIKADDIVPRRFTISDDHRYFEVTACPVIDGNGLIQSIAVSIWDATASRELQEKLNAIDRAGRELVRLEPEIIEKLDIPQRLELLEEKIIRNTKQILGFDKFCIRLLDKKTNRLELVLSSGLTEEANNLDIFASPEGNGISGYVAATGRSYICHDIKNDRRYICGIDNAASSLTVPLYLNDSVIGVFNIESDKPSAFDEDDRQFAEIFGRYVAIALHILDLMVVERHRTRGQLADNVSSEISGPLNDILVEATSIMEDYIGNDDLRKRVQTICDKVAEIREAIKQVAKGPSRLLGKKPEAPQKDAVLSGKRVLVADDEEIILQTISDILSKYGCVVDIAKEGQDAVEKIKNNDYDIILSDIKLPGRSGYEVFSAAKDKDEEVPVIFMTGFGYDPNHSIIRARQEGLSGVLYKPFKVDELLSVLREAIREKQSSK